VCFKLYFNINVSYFLLEFQWPCRKEATSVKDALSSYLFFPKESTRSGSINHESRIGFGSRQGNKDYDGEPPAEGLYDVPSMPETFQQHHEIEIYATRPTSLAHAEEYLTESTDDPALGIHTGCLQ